MGDDEIPFPDFFPEEWGEEPEDGAGDDARPGEGRADDEPPDETPEPFPGATLLRGTRPSQILARITDGDPLGVGPRVMQFLRKRAVLMDSARLCLRTMAHIAHDAPFYEGDPPITEWIGEVIERSVRDLMQEDAYDEATKSPLRQPTDERYDFLVNLLGIPPGKARRACVTFNALPSRDRRTFWAVCVEGKSVHRYVAEGNGPPKKVKRRIENVFRALSFLDEDPPDLFSEGGFR